MLGRHDREPASGRARACEDPGERLARRSDGAAYAVGPFLQRRDADQDVVRELRAGIELDARQERQPDLGGERPVERLLADQPFLPQGLVRGDAEPRRDRSRPRQGIPIDAVPLEKGDLDRQRLHRAPADAGAT